MEGGRGWGPLPLATPFTPHFPKSNLHPLALLAIESPLANHGFDSRRAAGEPPCFSQLQFTRSQSQPHASFICEPGAEGEGLRSCDSFLSNHHWPMKRKSGFPCKCSPHALYTTSSQTHGIEPISVRRCSFWAAAPQVFSGGHCQSAGRWIQTSRSHPAHLPIQRPAAGVALQPALRQK
jgi:hypothetical protein